MQAARGASLNPGDDQGATTRTHVRLFAAVALVALVLDQVTKVLAVEKLQGRDSIELIPGLLSLSFLRNPGAALSTGAGFTLVLSLIAIAVCIGVIRIAPRLRDRGWAVGLGLLLAGALGNLMDRIFREPSPLKGHVVDFIDYGVFVGNVADIALTLAALIIVWRAWRGVRIDGTREEKS
ncbi:signal peptidase II [Aeromicrobium fastidiosum]|uniref:Lipoprotein signal peptidase n=1 Tax=Aeromicrobium fastidiosum TaxID=52699 RepID=A0A641APP9_9ACTN|nr:signal peptidase II [Aeromicrobium fastidiosum]KAA1378691.1 signal peptidase II [Aeromicrobium fastidiosum]MBP2392322.1 signal peptidase II [Aeromicrobium fastidiosum]